jgi:protein gp37
MTTIEWTDETWNPVVGCSRVSAGCDHCYAMGVAHRGMSPQHRGLTKLRPKDASRPGVDWTGEVRPVASMLEKPLHWRKPRRVFVNSMSDLFHAQVPFEYIAAVFGVMAATPKHTYQVLTKRPERAREFFAWMTAQPRKWPGETDAAIAVRSAESHVGALGAEDVWPLRNVHLGVSVEDQATADERIPVLLQLPAAVRWVSYEPALGAVDFNAIQIPGEREGLRFSSIERAHDARFGSSDVLLDWIVVGGESGPGARPFDLAWARKTVEDCRGVDVPVFVKQLGARPYYRNDDYASDPDDRGSIRDLVLADRKGGNWDEWPAELRVREAVR